MVNKYSRAQRRHDRARLNKRAKGKLGGWGWYPDVWTDKEIQRYIGRFRDNMKACSCWMCKSPRKNRWLGNLLTLQELKAKDAYKDGIEDYEN